MALVCPVGHPPGTGTSFCRLCGRDYVESVDPVEAHAPAAPAPAAPAPEAAPVSLGFGQPAPGPGQAAPRAPGMVPAGEVGQPPVLAAPPAHVAPEPVLAEVVAMPPAAQPYQPHHGAPAPDLQVPPAPVELAAGHGGVQLQAALQTVPVTVPQQGEAPEAEQTPGVEDETPSTVKAAVNRTLLLAAAGAGFVGGVVATLAAGSLLG